MSKIIKEIIIVLLVILLSMLIFSVALYEYIPSRKQSAALTTYTATESVTNLLQDSVATENSEVILTYEVTNTDLNNYEKANEYVPGKQNPFAAYSAPTTTENPDGSNQNSTSGNTSASSGGTNNVTTENQVQNTTSNSYFKDTGTK